jgi:hypothetical protein
MKVIRFFTLLIIAVSTSYAQQLACNCYSSGMWPFKKENGLTFHQELEIADGITNFKIYAPILSSDTVNIKLLPEAFLWRFQKDDIAFIELKDEGDYSDFNLSFRIRLRKRSRLLVYDKISIEFSPLFNYETSQAPMLKKIILNSKKGLKRIVLEKGEQSITCIPQINLKRRY